MPLIPINPPGFIILYLFIGSIVAGFSIDRKDHTKHYDMIDMYYVMIFFISCSWPLFLPYKLGQYLKKRLNTLNSSRGTTIITPTTSSSSTTRKEDRKW